MPVKPLLAIVLMAMALSEPAFGATCAEDASSGEPARLAGFDAAGDLLLADGRVIRLVGLAPRQDEAEEARFRAAAQPYLDQEITLVITGEKDRWARWPARIGIAGETATAPDRDMALLLRQAGAARPLPEEGRACQPAPDATVTGGAGRTADSGRRTSGEAIDGHDLAAVKAQEGRYVVLEGRIASVGERPQRTYLNFSRKPKEAAAIVVSRKLWRELQGAGWTAAGLGGKRLRAHGVLGGRDGLLLEATSRAALELID